MNTLTIILLIIIVAVFAIVFGSKARAPSLFESLLFIAGFSMVILISTERWISWINYGINKLRMIFGMANKKFDITETLKALKSGDIDQTMAGTITITCILSLLALRLVTSLLALLAGIIVGICVKTWMIRYGISIEGLI